MIKSYKFSKLSKGDFNIKYSNDITIKELICIE